MEQQEFLSKIAPNRRIGQIGFFTKDIFQAMRNWDMEHGVSDWILYEHTNERLQNVTIREGICEEQFRFYCACGTMNGGIQLELIQPVCGLPFYENFLREHGEGAHHMKEIVPGDHYEEVLDFYASQGMPVLFGAEYFGSKFYFIDSVSKLGILLEIGNGQTPEGAPQGWKAPYPECLNYFKNRK